MTNKTFDLMGHLSGRTYPEDSIKVYLDEGAMYQLEQLEDRANLEKDSSKVNDIDEQKKALVETLEETALTFHLRGIPEEVKDAIQVQADADENKDDELFLDVAAVEAHILYIEDSQGARAEGFNFEAIKSLMKAMPGTERARLTSKVVDLSYSSISYERGDVNADF